MIYFDITYHNHNLRMRNMTKILDIRNEIIEIEARLVSSELQYSKIG